MTSGIKMLLCIGLTASTMFAQDIKTGLTAHYLLNGNAIDTTANTNDGIINGPVPAIDRNGNAGGAYYFDGSDDYIMVKHNSSIDIGGGSFTIAAWVKPGSSTGNWFDVVAKRNPYSTPGWCLQMCYGPEIKLWTSSDELKGYNYTFQQDAWYFVATVRDTATGTLTYYINGVKSAPMAFSKANESNLAAMAIGKLSEESHQYFHGSIDELRLYTRALSIYDLDSLYKVNNPFPIDTITPPPANPACIAHWSFDSSYQQTFYDVTGNGYDLINSGSAAINLNAGVNGKAFECTNTLFKGIVKNSQGNFNSKNFTIEAWIYSNVDLVNPGSFYNYHEIFSYQSVASGLSEGYNLEIRADGKIHLGIARTDGIEHWIVCPSDSVLKLRTWYYVAGTYDGSAMKLYIDGKLAKQVAYSGGYELPHNNAVIGCQMLKDSTYRNWFNGKIDELKLYNYALDSATIARTYNANVPQAEAPFEINLGMKQAFAKAGDTVTVPIYLTNYEDFAISSCQFTMHIDPAIITLLDVAKDSGLAKNWTLAFNPARPDSIIIGMAGVSQTLAYGEGELIRCRFIVSGSAAANSFSTIDLRHINVDEANKLVIATTSSGKISIKQPTFMYGDVTGNKAVTIGDAQKVLEYVVGSLTLPDASCPTFTTAVADVSGNGIITSYDAALIFQYSVGLISKFPVESTGIGKRLAKSTAIGAPAAIVSIAMPHLISTNIYQYTVHAENIYGLRAGEFAFACDPAIVKSIKDVSAGVRSANIQAQFDAATNRYKVGLTTNDRVTDLASDLLTITVEHKAGVAGTGLGISTALLNEGTIETNFLNQGLQTGIMDNKLSGILSLNIPVELTITNHDIQIGNPKGNAVSVQLFNLQGRRMFSKSFSTGTIKVSVGLTGRSAGLYICRIATGGQAYDRTIMIAQ